MGGRVGVLSDFERLDLVPDLVKFLEYAVRTLSRWAHHYFGTKIVTKGSILTHKPD